MMGNLGSDADIRITRKGHETANLSLMVVDKIKTPEGETQEIKNWFKVIVISPPLVRALQDFLKKGRRVYVSGRLNIRNWTDSTGKDNKTTEIIIDNRGTLRFIDPLPDVEKQSKTKEADIINIKGTPLKIMN